MFESHHELRPEEQAAPLSREACRVEGSKAGADAHASSPPGNSEAQTVHAKVEVATMTEHVPEPEASDPFGFWLGGFCCR